MASLHSVIESGTVEFEHIRKQPSEGTDELSILDAALSRVAVKESRIRDAYESGIDTLEEYKDNKLRIANERQELLAEIERLKELAASTPDDVPSEEEVLNRIKDVYSLLSDPDVSYDVKGAAVRSIIWILLLTRRKKKFIPLLRISAANPDKIRVCGIIIGFCHTAHHTDS